MLSQRSPEYIIEVEAMERSYFDGHLLDTKSSPIN
jgi:hypothetical protein